MHKNKKFITHGRYTFELIDYVPLGYEIWNIGRNMLEGYLPFCRIAARQPFPGGRSIEPDTLKAIKIEGAQLILDAVGDGPKTIEEMEQYIQRHKKEKSGTYAHMKVQKYKKALPVMRQIKWDK